MFNPFPVSDISTYGHNQHGIYKTIDKRSFFNGKY